MNNTTATTVFNKKEQLGIEFILCFIALCICYFCCSSISNKEREERFERNVKRAQARISLRSELASRV